MSTEPSPLARDPRVDLLRGLSLLSIFVDHIPKNRLADFTLHNLGFCDAAELFVILAGFSATSAYTRIFERSGLRVGLVRVLSRCLQIYGVQVALLVCTLLVVAAREQASGTPSLIVGPMLRDGWHGAMRGIMLRALPAYLDILPLYIVLLAIFPVIRFGMMRSPAATVGFSFALHAASNLLRFNLPNVVDRTSVAHWYFNPFTWQLVFVLGCWLATARRARLPVLATPPRALLSACWVYALAALVAVDAWRLWPPPFGDDPNGITPMITVLGNEPKTFVSPWRLLNVLAWVYLVLTSPRLVAVSRWRILRPAVLCGKHSLQVFAAGCILALAGRIVFRTFDVTALTQILVNVIGLGALLLLGTTLEWVKAGRARPYHGTEADAGRAAE